MCVCASVSNLGIIQIKVSFFQEHERPELVFTYVCMYITNIYIYIYIIHTHMFTNIPGSQNICIQTHTHTHTHTHVYDYSWQAESELTHACVQKHMHIYAHIYEHLAEAVKISVRMYIYIYIYIHIYIHAHTYMPYMYTHIHRRIPVCSWVEAVKIRVAFGTRSSSYFSARVSMYVCM